MEKLTEKQKVEKKITDNIKILEKMIKDAERRLKGNKKVLKDLQEGKINENQACFW